MRVSEAATAVFEITPLEAKACQCRVSRFGSIVAFPLRTHDESERIRGAIAAWIFFADSVFDDIIQKNTVSS